MNIGDFDRWLEGRIKYHQDLAHDPREAYALNAYTQVQSVMKNLELVQCQHSPESTEATPHSASSATDFRIPFQVVIRLEPGNPETT